MRKYLLLIASIAGLLYLAYACKQENDEPKEVYADSENWKEFREQAKLFFEEVYSPQVKTRTAQSFPVSAVMSSLTVIPDWEYGLYGANDEYAYVEFPLVSNQRFGVSAPDTPEEMITVQHRLVVLQDRKTGELSMYTALWIPDDKNSRAILHGLTLPDKGDFSGRVYLFYPDGQFYKGTYYKDGMHTASVNILEYAQEPVITRSGLDCTIHYEGYWEQECWYGSDGRLFGCSEWELHIEWAEMICIEEGGNGGDNTTGEGPKPPANPTPKATKIFKNTGLSEDEWKKLEKLLDKIINDCMGKALYNNTEKKLIRPLNIVLDPAIKGGQFNTANGEGVITLGEIEDHVLFHELLHAYQALNQADPAYKLNMEIEAWVAHYKYLCKQPYFVEGNYWYDMFNEHSLGISIIRLSNYLNSKGELSNTSEYDDFQKAIQNTKDFFQNTPGYHTYKFDENKNGLDNFRNLIELAKNC